MAFSRNAEKNNYHAILVKESRSLYSSWKGGTSSRSIVKKANAHAFDKQLKTSIRHRIKALVYAMALDLRIQNRYNTFFKKLIHPFASYKERAAYRLLKRVLGYTNRTDIEEMIMVELERLAMMITNFDDKDSTEGGKRSLREEQALEEALKNQIVDTTGGKRSEKGDLLEGEESQLEGEERSEGLDKSTPQSVHEEMQNSMRNGSVQNGRTEAQPMKGKESLSQGSGQREETVTKEQRNTSSQPSAANTSIYAEAMVLSKTEEPPSPFPIFRDLDTPPREMENEPSKDENTIRNQSDEEKVIDSKSTAGMESDREKMVIPVFNEGREEISRNTDFTEKGKEKTQEKSKETNKTEKDNEKEKIEGLEKDVISDTNKARRELNNTMTEEQIKAIAQQLQRGAQIAMEKGEAAWREQISVKVDVNSKIDNSALAKQTGTPEAPQNFKK